jgi:hypothetical protein
MNIADRYAKLTADRIARAEYARDKAAEQPTAEQVADSIINRWDALTAQAATRFPR